jgi:hypothetical protein
MSLEDQRERLVRERGGSEHGKDAMLSAMKGESGKDVADIERAAGLPTSTESLRATGGRIMATKEEVDGVAAATGRRGRASADQYVERAGEKMGAAFDEVMRRAGNPPSDSPKYAAAVRLSSRVDARIAVRDVNATTSSRQAWARYEAAEDQNYYTMAALYYHKAGLLFSQGK